MPDYFAPGVYIEEFESGSKPISGASTSIAAFIGSAKSGPCNEAVLVSSFGEFESVFGGFIASPRQYLAYAVDMFFKNGGGNAYIVRAAGSSGPLPAKASLTLMSNAPVPDEGEAPGLKPEPEPDTAAPAEKGEAKEAEFLPVLEITAKTDGEVGNGIRIKVANAAIPTAVTQKEIAKDSTELAVQSTECLCQGALIRVSGKEASGDNTIQEYTTVKKVIGKTVYLGDALKNDYSPVSASVESTRFSLTVMDEVGKAIEKFENLSLLQDDFRYFGKVVSDSDVITVKWAGEPYQPQNLDQMPVTVAGAPLSGGVDDKFDTPRDFGKALSALKTVDDASILAIPGEYGTDIYDKIVNHCYEAKYRVSILDPAPRLGKAEVRASRANEMSSAQGLAAFYYPWLRITDPVTREIISVPPSGAVAGVYARTDRTRGVHKAPANEALFGLVGLEAQLTSEDQAVLNPDGINAIRFFKGSGNLVWGARTISTDPSWRYINVRRLFIYLEQSIYNSTQWVVFEPNNERLWGRVKMTITEFLMRVWRDGMLMGSSPDEAFYVKCDRSTMTQSDIDAGKLIVEIGVAPVKPAEFVVFRITQWYEGVNK